MRPDCILLPGAELDVGPRSPAVVGRSLCEDRRCWVAGEQGDWSGVKMKETFFSKFWSFMFKLQTLLRCCVKSALNNKTHYHVPLLMENADKRQYAIGN